MAGGGLGCPNGGFKPDDAFLIFDPFFSDEQFVDDFLAVVGFFDYVSWFGSLVGNSGSLLEVEVWLKMTSAGRMVVVKMTA